jgi:hypothetical protein
MLLSVENEVDEFELLRRNMSALLIHTDEKHPIEYEMPIGKSLVSEVFMQPDEGIIWFKIEGADDLIEFDDMSIEDLIQIYHELL